MAKSASICLSPALLIRTAAGTGWGNGAGSVSEDSSHAAYLQQARSYLRNADPLLAPLIDDRPALDLRAWLPHLPPLDLYGALLFQVTSRPFSAAFEPAAGPPVARLGSA